MEGRSMSKSIKRQRREMYMQYPEGDFRKAVYSLAKSLQAQGMTIPENLQAYVNHCDDVKRKLPKAED